MPYYTHNLACTKTGHITVFTKTPVIYFFTLTPTFIAIPVLL